MEMTHPITLSGGAIPVIGTFGGGTACLRGSVQGADDGPLSRRVHIYEELGFNHPGNLTVGNLLHRGSTQSDPVTGEWEFLWLPNSSRYTVTAYDHTGQYDPVIKGGLVPEPMEP